MDEIKASGESHAELTFFTLSISFIRKRGVL